ncbi:MAG: hypothetical protein LBT01_04700 [Spirochaetaceae bacterium]|nr:hypothetical protein [Spirochaetaceae bacterium]
MKKAIHSSFTDTEKLRSQSENRRISTKNMVNCSSTPPPPIIAVIIIKSP